MSQSLITSDSMKATLLERQPQRSGVLPPLLTPERFLSFALLCLAETPKLYECTKVSVLAGIFQAAKDGLELGRDAYLVPFKRLLQIVTTVPLAVVPDADGSPTPQPEDPAPAPRPDRVNDPPATPPALPPDLVARGYYLVWSHPRPSLPPVSS